MGMSTTTYFGPFVHCKNSTVKKPIEVYGCSTCENQAKDPFCSTCGKAHKSFNIYKDREKVNAYEVLEGYDHLLYKAAERYGDDDNEYFLPNCSGVGFLFDSYSEEILITEGLDREKMLIAFEEKCSKAIEILREAYGPENCSIKFGIISFSN